MPEWLAPILEALGGGPMGVVLIGLAVAVVALWRSNNQLHRERLQDLKEGAATMQELAVETNRTVDALTTALGGKNERASQASARQASLRSG